jgi:hypothetical protein
MPIPQAPKLLKEDSSTTRILCNFFLCNRSGRSAVVNHAPPDLLLDLCQMPLNAIVGHVMTLDADRPKNSRAQQGPETTNHMKSSRDTIRKNTLFPVNQGPPPSTPRAVSKHFNNIHAPVPSILSSLALPKIVQNSLPSTNTAYRAALHNVDIDDPMPRIHLDSTMPHYLH